MGVGILQTVAVLETAGPRVKRLDLTEFDVSYMVFSNFLHLVGLFLPISSTGPRAMNPVNLPLIGEGTYLKVHNRMIRSYKGNAISSLSLNRKLQAICIYLKLQGFMKRGQIDAAGDTCHYLQIHTPIK